jgi:hypothetical protein
MRPGRLDVQLQEGRASDRAAGLPGPLPAGALRRADLGYWSLEVFAALAQHQVFWLSRLPMPTAVYDATVVRQDLLTRGIRAGFIAGTTDYSLSVGAKSSPMQLVVGTIFRLDVATPTSLYTV